MNPGLRHSLAVLAFAALAEGDQVPGRRLPSYQTRLAAVEQAAGEDIEG
ncbi:MAG: hypothetical protein FD152_3830, partial [Xanthobacteraceae bacterium]